VSGEGYRFGFNGKEDDRDWGTQNIQDYGFRLYNPSIGKFLSVDPLAPEYPELTTYQFASNTPLWAIDLDGLEAWKTNSGDVMYGPYEDKESMQEAFDNKSAADYYRETQGVHGHKPYSFNGSSDPLVIKNNLGWSGEEFVTTQRSEDLRQDARDISFMVDLALLTSGHVITKIPYLHQPEPFMLPSVAVRPSGVKGQTLFRGTTEGYAGNSSLQRLGVTPTSSDPAVATIFGMESSKNGKAMVYIANSDDLTGIARIEGNVLANLEREVALEILPIQFQSISSVKLTIEQSRNILSKIGVALPSKINGKAHLDQVLRDTPRLTEKQIQIYYQEALKIGKP